MKPEAGLSLVQMLSNISIAAAMLLIPKMAVELGASYLQVGLIGSCYGIALFVSSYLFGWLSDVRGRTLVLKVGLLACALTFALVPLADSPLSLALIRFLGGLSAGIYPAALVAYAYENTRSFGRFVSMTSLGWAVGSLLAGIIAVYAGIYAVASAFFLLSLVLAMRLPRSNPHLTPPAFPLGLFLKNKEVYVGFVLRHLGATAIWIVFPLYLTSLGASTLWIGVLYFANLFAQFVFLQLVGGIKSAVLFKLGLLASCLAFLLYSTANSFLDVLPMQLLLGFSWSTLYLGALKHLSEHNEERGTATGILNSLIGFSNTAGPIVGGVLSQCWGLTSTMYFAALLSACAFLWLAPRKM
ncbi:MAG: MFS transporter [Methermicoccaceae archaeon]